MINSRTSRKTQKYNFQAILDPFVSILNNKKDFEKNLDTLLFTTNRILFPHKKSRKSIE